MSGRKECSHPYLSQITDGENVVCGECRALILDMTDKTEHKKKTPNLDTICNDLDKKHGVATDKTERSETMLPFDELWEKCQPHKNYTNKEKSETWYLRGYREGCKNPITRPDAKDTAAMINTAYDIMEVWDTSGSRYNTDLKKEWLRKAREIYGAVPSL